MQVIFKTIKTEVLSLGICLGHICKTRNGGAREARARASHTHPDTLGEFPRELSRYFLPWSPTYSPEIFLFFYLCLLYFKTTKTPNAVSSCLPSHL